MASISDASAERGAGRSAGHRGTDADGLDALEPALAEALADLAAYCAGAHLRWRWFTRPARVGWQAEVQCGQADAQWQRIGAFPRWGGNGASAAEALRAAADAALAHWRPVRGDQYLQFMTTLA